MPRPQGYPQELHVTEQTQDREKQRGGTGVSCSSAGEWQEMVIIWGFVPNFLK